MPLRLTSDAFASGSPIPARHTCAGDNVSPPLRFAGVPAAARSLLLIVDDPDAPNGVFTHWVLYNLPADLDRLDEAFAPAAVDDTTGPAQGRNDFGNTFYEGPCPPPGDDAHRYYFRLYALDESFALPPGATRAQLLDRASGHILAETELIGAFQREPVPAEQLGQGTRGWDYEFYAELPDLSAEAMQQMRSETEQRLGELTRGNQDMVGASVAVEPVAAGQDQAPIRYRARVVVYIRPDNLAASEQDDTAQAALNRTLDAAERLVREQRKKLREPWKQPQAETPPAEP